MLIIVTEFTKRLTMTNAKLICRNAHLLLISGAVFLMAPLFLLEAQTDPSARGAGAPSAMSASKAEGTAELATSTPASVEATSIPSQPRDTGRIPVTPPPPVETKPAPIPLPPPAPAPIPVNISIPDSPLPEEGGNENIIIGAIAALAVAAICYGASRMLRKNDKSETKEDADKCNSIKSLLDQKKKELEDMARGLPKEKAMEKAKDLVLSEEQKELMRQIDAIKEKYNKAKKYVEILQGKYDMCKFEMSLWKDIVLVKAYPKDIEALLAIEKDLGGSKIYSAMTDKGEWEEEFKKGAVIYLVKKGDEVLGDTSYEKRADGSVYLSGLGIKKSFQNQGVGRIVISKIMEELKNVKNIDLVTHPENAAAIKLYESFGFKVESKRENYFGDGESRLVMVFQKK